MGIYAKYVLPRLIDLTMRNKDTARLRAEWVPQACGEVLEVGIGSGLNLPFYSSQVQRVRGRSFPGTPAYASQESRSATDQGRFFVTVGCGAGAPFECEYRHGGRNLDLVFYPESFTGTPASQATSEADFVEHGRSSDPSIGNGQERLTPLWKRIGGGCHLDRKIDDLIIAAGFQITELKTCYLPGPRPMTYTYQGLAQLAYPTAKDLF